MLSATPNASLAAPAKRVVSSTVAVVAGTTKTAAGAVLSFSITDLVKIFLIWPLVTWAFLTKVPYVSVVVAFSSATATTYNAFFDTHVAAPIKCSYDNGSPFKALAKRVAACNAHKVANKELSFPAAIGCVTGLIEPKDFAFDCKEDYGY